MMVGIGVVTAAVVQVVGCASDPATAPLPITPYTTSDPRLRAYLPSDSPSNIITNLETAYAKRDLDAYAQLFAPEFVFKFQPQDSELLGKESWGLESELESTRNMFYSGKVKTLEIRLQTEPAVPATEPGLEHTMLVVVTHTSLRITQYNGRIHEVNGDRQEFYLRRAHGENGKESWLIVEWRDLPGS